MTEPSDYAAKIDDALRRIATCASVRSLASGECGTFALALAAQLRAQGLEAGLTVIYDDADGFGELRYFHQFDDPTYRALTPDGTAEVRQVTGPDAEADAPHIASHVLVSVRRPDGGLDFLDEEGLTPEPDLPDLARRWQPDYGLLLHVPDTPDLRLLIELTTDHNDTPEWWEERLDWLDTYYAAGGDDVDWLAEAIDGDYLGTGQPLLRSAHSPG